MMPGANPPTSRPDGGWALISVLGTVLILSLIAAGLVSLSYATLRIGRTERAQLEASAIADAAISRAVVGLLDPRIDARWRVDGVARLFQFGDARVTVRIQDELGKIDLNAADGGLLARLLETTGGLDKDGARDLADKIMDWREADDLRHLHGATRNDYLAAGMSYAPRNGPFQSVSEVKLVLGMTEDLFARIAPALTVYSRRPTFDPQTAPREALLTLPGIDAARAEQTIRERATNAQVAAGPSVFARPGIFAEGIPLDGRSFTITATFDHRGRRYAASATVMMTGDPRRPYLAQAWSIE
jgi:general secretion pathway protein K